MKHHLNFFLLAPLTMSSQADSICYTIINVSTDNESINELSLKNDLGMFLISIIIGKMTIVS